MQVKIWPLFQYKDVFQGIGIRDTHHKDDTIWQLSYVYDQNILNENDSIFFFFF